MSHYLVFDIETRVDKDLVKEIHDPEDSLTVEQAYDKARDELLERSNQRSDFFPVPFHIPIAIATLQADQNYRIQTLGCMGVDRFSEEEMISRFWKVFEDSQTIQRRLPHRPLRFSRQFRRRPSKGLSGCSGKIGRAPGKILHCRRGCGVSFSTEPLEGNQPILYHRRPADILALSACGAAPRQARCRSIRFCLVGCSRKSPPTGRRRRYREFSSGLPHPVATGRLLGR